jgi:peptidoglycan/LPS O-acetylase OafA/YrhL
MVESIELKEQANFRLLFLDFIRGIAALSVFFQHACEGLWPEFWSFSHNSFNLGKFGVVIFFLTSGFIIPFSLERGGSARKFWISRFFRLYPLYWTSLAFVVMLEIIGIPSVPPVFRSNLLRNFLVNITMFQDFVGVPPAIGVYATLTLELVFYITCTILFLFKLHTKSYMWAWGVFGLTVFGSVLAPLGLEKRLPMAAMIYILSMFFGTVLYRYYSKVVTKRQLVQLLVAVVCVAIAGTYINYVLYKKEAEHFTFLAVMAPWTAGYAFFLGAFTFRNMIFPQVFSWLGKISYSVYLMHPVILGVTPNLSYRPLKLVVMLACTLILASATYNLIEQPLIELGRKLSKKIVVVKPKTNPSF